MNAKRILVFILWAFLPMIGVGVAIHLIGNPAAEAANNPIAALPAMLFSAGAMLIPLLAVIFTQLIFKEPVLRNLGVSFKINRWWWIGWLLMPVIAFAVLGVSLLMPGAHWAADSEIIQLALQQLPEGFGIGGFIAITMLSGMIAGVTLNAVFAFGEEIAWRGFLVKVFKGKKFMTAALLIGIIWGLWHFPLILNGHNYPQHPIIGIFAMVLFCVAFTPILLYFRQKSGSVIVPAIMHGTFNGVIGISNLLVAPQNDLLIGGPGLAGLLVLLSVDLLIFFFDRYVTKERLFTQTL